MDSGVLPAKFNGTSYCLPLIVPRISPLMNSCKVTPRRLPNPPRTALAHLRKVDPALAPIIDRWGVPELPGRSVTLGAICGDIIGQQLSVRVADVIRGRFFALPGVGEDPAPDSIFAITDETLRAAGLSRAKIAAVRDLARFWGEHNLAHEQLAGMPDEDLIELLTQVRGIGPWTVKMILIFSLRRPDVLPFEDLGLRMGLQKVDGLAERPTPKQVIARAEIWAPYRSLGTWYCWQSLRK